MTNPDSPLEKSASASLAALNTRQRLLRTCRPCSIAGIRCHRFAAGSRRVTAARGRARHVPLIPSRSFDTARARHGVTVGSGEEQASVGVMFELAVFSKASESGLAVISI
jgi:hypothetical protein